MTCLDLLLRALKAAPASTCTLELRIFQDSGLIIAGSTHLPPAKQLDAWARAHGLLCVHDVKRQCCVFSVLAENPTIPQPTAP